MKREEKQVIIDNLTEQIKAYKHVYISDISELDAAATQALRKVCFESNIKLIQVKNTLLRVALETLDTDYIRKITDALSSAREANRKAVISIDGLEKNQGDINKLISQQGQIIKVLSNFKAEIEKIKD